VRRLLLLVGAIVFVDTMFFAALTPLLPHYSEEFDLSKAGAGILAAAYPAGALVAGVPCGLAAARLGVRPTILFGLVLIAATTVVFGFAGSIVLLDVARFAQGVGSSAAWTGALAWLVAETEPSRRGAVIGAAMGTAVAGALFGPVLGAAAALAGTRVAFGAVGVLALLLTAWAWSTAAPAPRPEQSLRALWRALGSRRIQAGIWFVTLPALLFGTLGVLAPLRLSALGWGAVAIGATFLVSAAFEAVVNPLVGRLSDRRGWRLPIELGVAASLVVTLLLPWPDRPWLLAGIVVCAAMSFGVFWTPAMSLLSDTAERLGLDHAFAFALVNLAWAPGQALGAAGGGALARHSADAVPYLVLSAACLGTLLAFRVGKPV
jgi:MFS family permease